MGLKVKEILADATNKLNAVFGRNDFEVTEIPVDDDTCIAYCVCTNDMQLQTVTVYFMDNKYSIDFDNFDTGENVECSTLDEAFKFARDYEQEYKLKHGQI